MRCVLVPSGLSVSSQVTSGDVGGELAASEVMHVLWRPCMKTSTFHGPGVSG